jgi:putative tricarboxylic transport membrane protein
MMMRREMIDALFFLFLGLFYFFSGLQYSMGRATAPGLGLFPRLVAIALLLCAFAMSVESFLHSRKGKDEEIKRVKLQPWHRLLRSPGFLVVIGVAGYLLLLQVVGYLVMTTVLIVYLGAIMGGGSWVSRVILAIASSALTYWLFRTVMQVPLPLGGIWGN